MLAVSEEPCDKSSFPQTGNGIFWPTLTLYVKLLKERTKGLDGGIELQA
jgi:hypothetical protein